MGEPVVTTYTYDHAGRLARTETVWWTDSDRQAAMALQDYEDGYCPGGPHLLEETSKLEHDGAYQGQEPIRCHLCTARVAIDRNADEKSAGVVVPIKLNLEVVELNKQPVPPLPPELGG